LVVFRALAAGQKLARLHNNGPYWTSYFLTASSMGGTVFAQELVLYVKTQLKKSITRKRTLNPPWKLLWVSIHVWTSFLPSLNKIENEVFGQLTTVVSIVARKCTFYINAELKKSITQKRAQTPTRKFLWVLTHMCTSFVQSLKFLKNAVFLLLTFDLWHM
jgi:hypothetical protein